MSILNLVILFSSCFSAAENGKAIVKNFIDVMANKEVSLEDVKQNYLLLSGGLSDEEITTRNEILDLQLQSCRDSIRQIENTSEFQILNYQEGKEKSMTKGLDVENDDFENVYLVVRNEKVFTYIWISKQRIKSFSTMSKGDMHKFFMTY